MHCPRHIWLNLFEAYLSKQLAVQGQVSENTKVSLFESNQVNRYYQVKALAFHSIYRIVSAAVQNFYVQNIFRLWPTVIWYVL